MNSLPTPSKKHSPRRTLCRPSNFLSSSSRCFIYSRSSKLHFNRNQYTMTRTSTRTNPTIRMGSNHYCSTPFIILTSPCRSNYHTPNRPQPKYFILRSSWRWRPNPISTFILILWPSRSIHFNYSRVRCHLPYCNPLQN